MKFLIDAQLPRRLALLLGSLGHDTLHTMDLPEKNRTRDESLRLRALMEERILVTKDADFVDSFLVRGVPSKLLFVTTGNITNDALIELFSTNLEAVENGFASCSFIEIDRDGLTLHTQQ